MSYFGWPLFKFLGYKGIIKFWSYIDDNCITKWKINCVYISVPGFSADGLTSKIYFLIVLKTLLF